MDFGLCAIDIFCQEEAPFRTYRTGKNRCYIDNIADTESEVSSVAFYVDYAQPSDIEEVYFAPSTLSDCEAAANDIGVILSGLFSMFPNLAELSLGANLRELNSDDFTEAINLTSLFIPYNNFQKIKSTMFTSVTNENVINFDEDEFPLHRLENMDLSWNSISEIEVNSFSRLKSLKLLILSDNELTIIQKGTFEGLASLTRLYLQMNKIETIEDGALDLPSLWLLELSDNKLKRLSDAVFDGLPKVELVRLHHNDIEYIGQSLYHLENAKNISLNENEIKDVDLAAFAQLPKLRHLALANSGFMFSTTEIDNSQEWNSTLIDLQLGNNNLFDATQLSQLRVFPNLEHLDVGKNSLVNLDVGDNQMLEDILPSLKSLTVGANEMHCANIIGIENSSEKPIVLQMATHSGTLRFTC